jgi:hypothetical protein
VGQADWFELRSARETAFVSFPITPYGFRGTLTHLL